MHFQTLLRIVSINFVSCDIYIKTELSCKVSQNRRSRNLKLGSFVVLDNAYTMLKILLITEYGEEIVDESDVVPEKKTRDSVRLINRHIEKVILLVTPKGSSRATSS